MLRFFAEPRVHQVSALLDRRRATRGLGLIAIAIASSLNGALAGDASKKKKRRRKRKRRKQRNRSSPPTCAEQCPAAFDACFPRAADSTLCADTFSTSCRPCFSDQDCVGSENPYCLTLDGAVLRETEEPITVLRSLCGPFLDAVCAQMIN